jgi:hypothetical protein
VDAAIEAADHRRVNAQAIVFDMDQGLIIVALSLQPLKHKIPDSLKPGITASSSTRSSNPQILPPTQLIHPPRR